MIQVQILKGGEIRNVTDRYAARLIEAGEAIIYEKKEEKAKPETKENKVKRQTKAKK